MKSAESKSASNTIMRSGSPFFTKESDQQAISPAPGTKPFFPAASRGAPVQAKLNIGSPNDPFEKEADSTADKVVQRLAEPAVQTKPMMPSVSPYVQKKPAATEEDKKVKELTEEEDLSMETKRLRLKPIFESNAEPPDENQTVQRKCSHCESEDKLQKKNESTPVQRKPIFESRAEPSGEEKNIQRTLSAGGQGNIQKKSGESGTDEASPEIESSLQSSRGAGHPLPEKTRGQMESSIGADFSNVRIHDDSTAAKMSKDLNAQAFTHGNDIYFNSGKYDTGSSGGQHLLAHELTHTVQQSGGSQQPVREKIQKKEKDKNEKPNFKKASAKDLEDAGNTAGFVQKTGATRFTFHINKLSSKKYDLAPSAVNIFNANKPSLMPRPGTRETNQDTKWKSGVRKEVKAQILKLAKLDEGFDTSTLYKLTHEKGKEAGKGIVGTITQLVNEILVPNWSSKGGPNIYQIEHSVDWQVLGPKADHIDNLILLEAKKNGAVGKVVADAIESALNKVIKVYKQNFEGAPDSIEDVRTKYDCRIDDLDSKGPALKDPDFYCADDLKDDKSSKNPFAQGFILVKEEKIPKDHFLLSSSDRRASYIIPNKAKKLKIGAFLVTVDYNTKDKEVISVKFDNLQGKEMAKVGIKEDLASKEVKIKKESQDKYVVQDGAEKGIISPMLKTLSLPKFSPIEIAEQDIKIEGFDVSAEGKVISTLSFLQGVDISFSYMNGEFNVSAVIPLDAISKNVPKPFKVEYCNIEIGGGSQTPVFIAGGLGFGIEKLGTGEIFAKLDKTLTLGGKFNFDSKYFDPAEISITYADGKWSITGSIGIQEGIIKGVKSATLNVGYDKGTFTLDGDAELTIPGIDKVKLHADFAENGDFTFIATVDLKAMTGIKSGSATVTVSSTGGEGLKLGLKGEAEPDLPNVPSLNNIKLAISYLDGIFELKASVAFKKGKFDGTLDVGVTNRQVDETGKPQGEAPAKGDVVVFGYGKLGVDIYKGINGSVSIRLTPDKEVLIAGKIEAKELKPFGDGYNYDKEILPFPTLEFPLAGIPGISVSAFISGGVHFKFNWLPLVLKDLSLDFKETNIKELDKASLEITGSIGSSAHAEVYLKIEAGLKARVAIAVLKGSLAGEAGLALDAEAGGKVDATWDMEKGLKFKEVRAFLDVTPKAVFRLTGNVSVDLDLWIASVNLYEHQWVLAEKQLDLSGITLKLDFPIKFKETGEAELPEYEQMNVQKPDFSGDAGMKILDDAINGDAKKEEAAKKEKIKTDIHNDMHNADNKDVTPSDYTKKMMDKYEDTPELQAFVKTTIEEEAKKMEYEDFEKQKQIVRNTQVPLENKLSLLSMFTMFHGYLAETDIDAFRSELKKADEEKKLIASNAANAAAVPGQDNKPQGDTPAPPPPPPPPPAPSTGNKETPVQTKQMPGAEGSIQKKEDKHDLTSKDLAGEPALESCFDNLKIIGKTETGNHVKRIQQGLIRLGIALPHFGPDGKYGDETKNAVTEFQKKAGMSEVEQDGIVGRKTIGLLDRSLRNGSISGDPDKSEKDFVLNDPRQVKKDNDCKDKPTDEPCPTPNKDVIEAADAAIALIDKVLGEQLPPGKTAKADYTVIFDLLFRNNDSRDISITVNEVKNNFNEIKKFLELIKKDPSHVRCGTLCDGGCRANTPAYHTKAGGFNLLTFCPDFKKHPERILIVLHESHHAAINGSRDIAYQHTRLIDKLDHKQALLNAASFHLYASLVNDPGSDHIGPAVKDAHSIADPDKQKKVDLALGFIEQWMKLVTFDMSRISTDMDAAKNRGTYEEGADIKTIQDVYVKWFQVTAPPNKPKESDVTEAKAIEERSNTMKEAFRQIFSINETTGSSSWERGPGKNISLNQSLLGLDMRHLVIALLQELVDATPDISAEREPLYVGLINDLRNIRAMDP